MTHEEALALIETEHKHAVETHGARFSCHLEMHEVLFDELLEVSYALNRSDINGEHGVKRELAQVAAVCLKALEGIDDAPK